jgi:hypothetical protein
MSCCKDNLLLFIEIRKDQKADTVFLETAKSVLTEYVNYTDEQAELAIDFAKRTGKCLILEGTVKEVGSITTQLAKNKIGAIVENKSLK